MKIEERTLLITGGAMRVGKSITLRAVEAGASVIIHSSSSYEAAKELSREIVRRGGDAYPVQADLSEPQQIDRMFEELHREGRIPDSVVNCASVFSKDDSLSGFQQTSAVNLQAPFIISQKLAQLREATGMDDMCIINILDAKLDHPSAGYSAYYAAKGGLLYLTKALAVELAPGIRVNAVSPGAVLARGGIDEGYFALQRERLPLKRVGTPEAVADAVLYLLGADFITGENLRIDGGSHLL